MPPVKLLTVCVLATPLENRHASATKALLARPAKQKFAPTNVLGMASALTTSATARKSGVAVVAKPRSAPKVVFLERAKTKNATASRATGEKLAIYWRVPTTTAAIMERVTMAKVFAPAMTAGVDQGAPNSMKSSVFHSATSSVATCTTKDESPSSTKRVARGVSSRGKNAWKSAPRLTAARRSSLVLLALVIIRDEALRWLYIEKKKTTYGQLLRKRAAAALMSPSQVSHLLIWLFGSLFHFVIYTQKSQLNFIAISHPRHHPTLVLHSDI
jgi:hypothetical protein